MTDEVASNDDLVTAALRLALVPGVGPRLYMRLCRALGSPQAVLAAAPSTLREIEGIGTKLARAIATAGEIDLAGELDRCRQHQIQVLSTADAGYPTRLREIDDPPPILFCRGEFLAADELAIAIVGTRHASVYGRQQARRLAHELASMGLTVVSGLARGIDAAAHEGCLAAGGRTIAVLGSGLLNLYPPEHAELAERVAAQGVLASESPTLQSPKSGIFPQRNRLISGLSLGVIVVEAAVQSGALITARHAMEQGREVFAVPGRIDNRMARGCHQLIRDGAKLVESVDDILCELGPLATTSQPAADRQVRHPAELVLNDQEQAVLQAIDLEPTAIDDIVAKTQLPVQRVLATISALEIRRLVRHISGAQVIRC